MARRKLSFWKSRPLPEDFTRDYVIAIRALSRKHKDDPETLKALKLLKRMSKEAFLAGRGEVWMPRPGSTTGHYPVIENVPFDKVKRAIRKNTKRRQKAWGAVAASTRPFFPLRSTIGQVEKSLLPAAVVSLPFVRGRTPALLGKRVPGELKMTKSGSSIIPIRSMSPAEWTQGGYQPLKFARLLGVRRRASLPPETLAYEQGFQYGLRSLLRRHKVGEKLRKGALPAALGGIVMAGLQRIQTEWGMPPTTVDLRPILRTSLKSEYAPFANVQLRSFREALKEKLATADDATTNEILKQIGKINVEMIGRRAV